MRRTLPIPAMLARTPSLFGAARDVSQMFTVAHTLGAAWAGAAASAAAGVGRTSMGRDTGRGTKGCASLPHSSVCDKPAAPS